MLPLHTVQKGHLMAATIIDRSKCPARRHGRYWMANSLGCRCIDALTERSVRDNAKRRGHLAPGYTDATGTRRRLQALAREGWTLRHIAALTGVSDRTLVAAQSRQGRVQTTTARAVAAVYNRAAGQGGPSTLAASRARGRSWLDSYHWPDDRIDDPNAEPWYGDDARQADREFKRALVAELTTAGLVDGDIAWRLNTTARSVQRNLATIRDRQAAA